MCVYYLVVDLILFLLGFVFRVLMFYMLFFFFKQKTAYEMRISDWSSDVCSSDLAPIVILADATDDPRPRRLSFGLSMGEWEKLPVFALGKDERHGAIAKAHDDQEAAEREEHWRLLYVAMTRAEELLVVTGITKTS